MMPTPSYIHFFDFEFTVESYEDYDNVPAVEIRASIQAKLDATPDFELLEHLKCTQTLEPYGEVPRDNPQPHGANQ